MAQMNMAMIVLIAAFLAPALTALIGGVRHAWVPKVAILLTAIAFAAALAAQFTADAAVTYRWAPSWDWQFELRLDGLAKMYALLATGIGLAVVLYASRYIELHLHHGHRSLTEQTRFFAFLLLFMAAMVGLVMAQDATLIFVFWDLTAIASYYLIGYDRAEEESRSSAMMALLVTGITAVLVLIGAMLLQLQYGTWSLPAMIAAGAPDTTSKWALVLIAVGALAKSAQVPLHFWLPRAMAAPTPVSAYLHSAAMVAAGVFLIGRFYPLMMQVDLLLTAFLVIGFASMVVGGIIALTRNVLKQVLAYSTISQYGYVVFMFGMGGEYGVKGATFYVLAHAIVKSALFMTAGAVTEATGKKTLAEIGGLGRSMPLLAIGSGLSAAGLIALPLTIGFFKDELFFARAAELGQPYIVLTVAGAAMTFAYIFRFWTHIFLGVQPTAPGPISNWLVWPIVILGVLAVIGGVWTAPFTDIAGKAAGVSLNQPVSLHVAYHLDTRAENLMAVATWIVGLTLYFTRRLWWQLAIGVSYLGERIGPAHWYYVWLQSLNATSDRIHDFEVRDLRSRVATILLPAGILVGLAVVVTPNSNSFEIGPLSSTDLPLIVMLVASVVSAFVAVLLRDHFRLAIGLSSVGYSLAAVYAFMGAPNVTVVALVIETMLSLFLLGMLALMPRSILRFETEARPDRRIIPKDAILATVAGLLVFFVAWGALSRPAPGTELIDSFAVLTPAVHGYNIVTVILAEFRGIDTMGEITVIVLTMLGIISLLRSGRLR